MDLPGREQVSVHAERSRPQLENQAANPFSPSAKMWASCRVSKIILARGVTSVWPLISASIIKDLSSTPDCFESPKKEWTLWP